MVILINAFIYFLSLIWILPSKTILICIYDGMPKMELCSIDDVPDIGKL